MTQSDKLIGRIAEKGYNVSSLSRKLNISRPSLRNKIQNKGDFRASEIEAICSVLDIKSSDIGFYFFYN